MVKRKRTIIEKEKGEVKLKNLSERKEMNKKMIGKVRFFYAERGFGFIKPDDGSEDVFVHQSNIHAKGFRMLQEDERVEFEVEFDNISGKKKAINVTGLGGAYVQGG